jgi:hypothetical protein
VPADYPTSGRKYRSPRSKPKKRPRPAPTSGAEQRYIAESHRNTFTRPKAEVRTPVAAPSPQLQAKGERAADRRHKAEARIERKSERATRRRTREQRQERQERRTRARVEAGATFGRLSKPGRAPDVGFERELEDARSRTRAAVEKLPNPPRPKPRQRSVGVDAAFPGLRPKAPKPQKAPKPPKPDREDKAFMKTARPEAKLGYAAERAREPRLQRAAEKRRKRIDEGPRESAEVKRLKAMKERLERESAAISQLSPKAKRIRERAVKIDRRIAELGGDGDTHIGPFNLEAELEGRGLVQKGAEWLKEKQAVNAQQAGLGEAGEALAKDVVDFGAQAIPSAYGVAAGLREASMGDSKRLKEQVTAIKEGDPIALLAQGRVNDALNAFEEHPGLSLATLYGGTAAVSRGVGAGARAGIAGKAGKEFASRERAPKQGPGGLYKPQQYSKGIVRNRLQRRLERKEQRKADRLAAQAKEARDRGDAKEAEALEQKAVRARPFRMTEKEVNQAVDQLHAIEYPISRRNRDDRLREVDDLFRDLKPDEQVTSVLLSQNIIRPTRESIQGYIDHLKSRDGSRGPYRTKLRRRLISQLEAVLKNNRDLDGLEDLAREYARRTEPLQDKLVDIGVLDAASRQGAKLTPTLTRHVEATFDEKPQKTPATLAWEALRAQETATLKEVAQLERRYNAAVKRESFQEGKATVQAQHGRRVVAKTSPRVPREEFIAARPKADRRDTPTVESLTSDLTNRTGAPGIARETEHGQPGSYLHRFDRQREAEGLSPSTVTYVQRGPDGEPQGALKILLDEDGEPTLMEVAVAESRRGKGTAKGLLAAAADEFGRAKLEKAYREGGLTEDGAGLAHSVLTPRKTGRRTDLTERQGNRLIAEQSRRAEIERKLLDARDRLQKLRYERRKAKPRKEDRTSREWRTADGEVVPLTNVEQWLRENPDMPNPEEIAMITQNPALAGARKAFYVPGGSGGPRGLTSKRRTGRAVEEGEFGADAEAARSTVANAQGIIDNFESYARQVSLLGHPDVRVSKKAAADDAARNLEVETGYRWRAVPLKPMFGRQAHANELVRRADELAVREVLNTSLSGNVGDAPGAQWTVIPEVAAKRLQEHLSALPTGTFGRALRGYNRLFRGVVLTTSPAWMLGNFAEGTMRTALSRSGPVDFKFMHDVLAELERIDPTRAAEFDAMIGRGQFGLSELNQVRTVLEHYQGSALEPLAKAFDFARHAPGPRQIANAWTRYTDFVFGFNGHMEHWMRTAMAGQVAKEQFLKPGDLKNWNTAVRQAAEGLRGTNEQIAVARQIRRAYGQYEAFSPGMRKAVTYFTPFVAWYLNAIKFVYQVLPADHPVAFAMLAEAELATQEWREKMGLGQFIEAPLPGWLQGSVPLGDGWNRINRYTPFGAFSDPFGTGAQQFLPHIMGAIMAGRGLDWKGEPLADKDAPGDVTFAEKAEGIAVALLGSTIPLFSPAVRINKDGLGALNPLEPVERTDRKTDLAYDRAKRWTDERTQIRADWIQKKVDAGMKWPKAKEAWDRHRERLPKSHPYNRLGRMIERAEEQKFKGSEGQYGTAPDKGDTGGSDNPLDAIDEGASENPLDAIDEGAAENPLDVLE